MSECSTPGCKNPHHAKGKCHTCYTRERRNKPVTKSVTSTPKDTSTKSPGKAKRNTRATRHYFNYFCNYNGDISKGRDLNNGWYRLERNDFLKILPIVNQQLGLKNTERWENTTRGPKISVLFTTINNTIHFSIEHCSWPSVEAMNIDAYTFARILEDELTLNIIEVGKGLRRATKREIECHTALLDKNVEQHQKEGIGNYKGPKHNGGFFTLSHPEQIQHETERDMERHTALNDALGHPETEGPESTTGMSYDFKMFLAALGAFNKGQREIVKHTLEQTEAINRIAGPGPVPAPIESIERPGARGGIIGEFINHYEGKK